MDIASPWDHRLYEKESEKIEKHQYSLGRQHLVECQYLVESFQLSLPPLVS